MSGSYVKGESLEVTVDSVPPDHSIAHGQLRLQIVSVFRAITMSPVMLVRFRSRAGDEMEAVLKLHDWRVGTDFRRRTHE